MNTFAAIKQRTSVRDWDDKPVSREQLEQLVDAGRRAPTAINIQPWEFIVVTEKNKLREIARATDYGRFIDKAAACIIVYCKSTKYYLEDGCAAVENILLAATDLSLAACWVAGDKKPYTRYMSSLLNVPEDYKLIAIIPVGYPKYPSAPKSKRPLRDVLHWESF